MRDSISNSLSVAEARRVALAAQGFGFGKQQSDSQASWRQIKPVIDRMGLLQIDTINILIRSHYLPVFSRLGAYDIKLFDTKAFGSTQRQLFEYWGHEASLIPLTMQPLFRWRMEKARNLQGIYRQLKKLVEQKPAYINTIFAEIKTRGPLAARELQNRQKENGSGSGSWRWDDGKAALEYLFWTGQITTASRRGFERVYDLTERVIPANILNLPTPTADDAQRQLLNIAGQALGVASEADLRDYFRLSATEAKPRIAELVENGDIYPVHIDNWKQPAYLHRNAKLPGKISAQALLTPFDPLVWERNRIERLFDFNYRIEIYTPVAKRRYGYYVLPFLVDERLAARVDLQADRNNQNLRVLACYIEDDITSEPVVTTLGVELLKLATWLNLSDVVIKQRGNLARPLRHAMKTLS